jgi:hypothetical protein
LIKWLTHGAPVRRPLSSLSGACDKMPR